MSIYSRGTTTFFFIINHSIVLGALKKISERDCLPNEIILIFSYSTKKHSFIFYLNIFQKKFKSKLIMMKYQNLIPEKIQQFKSKQCFDIIN